MASAPRFIASPFADNGLINNVSTDIDGGGSYDVVATAGASGARFDGCVISPLDPCSNVRINFFLNNAAGTRFIGKLMIPQDNVNDADGPGQYPFDPVRGPILMANTDTIEAAVHSSANTVDFAARPLGGNY